VASDGQKYCSNHASVVDGETPEGWAPRGFGGCQYPVATKPGGVCGLKKRREASDGERYCGRHASVVDGGTETGLPPSRYSGPCPFLNASLPGGRCDKQRERIASDEEKYCDRHCSIVDKKTASGAELLDYKGTCPFICPETNLRCTAKRKRVALDGDKYCTGHASQVDETTPFSKRPKLLHGPCPGEDPQGPEGQCGKRRQYVVTGTKEKLCKRHGKMAEGLAVRAAEIPLASRYPVRKRLRGKQPIPPAYSEFKEEGPAGFKFRYRCSVARCTERGRYRYEGFWFCYGHAVEHRLPRLAHVPLDAYSDANVPTHDAGSLDKHCAILGPDGEDYGCGARYFAGEATSTGRFTLCCFNGKLQHIPPPQPPPPVLRELLISSSQAAKDFRQAPHDSITLVISGRRLARIGWPAPLPRSSLRGAPVLSAATHRAPGKTPTFYPSLG